MSKTLRAMAGLLICAMIGLPTQNARSQTAPVSDAQQLVDKAKLTAEKMLNDPQLNTLRQWMKSAKGVLIVPSFLKAGFIIGGGGGSGVLLSRDGAGQWSAPAFYTMGEGSIGFQAGVQDAEMILVIMTDKGLIALIDSEVRLGADASIALGETGSGVEGSTTAGLGKDIYTYSKTSGLYGGVTLEGAWVRARDNLNGEYYGKTATPRAIVIDRQFTNNGANELRGTLALAR
jgi:lipid-binding SYLF domain-containing protein